jgi:hypothetical protein
VFLRESANLSKGGVARDVTDQVHSSVQWTCERAARTVGLDICGVDLVLADIAEPLDARRGGILELNAAPGLRMHCSPNEGRSRDVGGAIVEEAGRVAARAFDRVIVREDVDLRGRQAGEIASLLERAIREEAPERPVTRILDEREALTSAIETMEAEEVILLLYDRLEPLVEILRRYEAEPVQSFTDGRVRSRMTA